MERLMKELKMLKEKDPVHIDHEDDDHHSHDDDDDHESHDVTTEVMDYNVFDLLPYDFSLEGIHGDNAPCLRNVTDVIKEYYPDNEDGRINITQTEFFFILPRLLYDLQSSDCHPDAHDHDHGNDPDEIEEDRGKVWGIALGAVAIISLLSLVGIMIVPLMGHSSYFQRLISFLVALAVGTLVGDALLHLLPHAMGGHEHGHEHDEEGSSDEKKKIMKSLVAVLGIYAFFVFESSMAMLRKRKSKKRIQSSFGSAPKLLIHSADKSEDFLITSKADAEGSLPRTSGSRTSRGEDTYKSGDSGISSTSNVDGKLAIHSSVKSFKPLVSENTGNKTPPFPLKLNLSQNDDDEDLSCGTKVIAPPHDGLLPHPHDDHHHRHDDIVNAQGIKDLAWMILAGDGLHNFSDGLAIGAAFSSSISAGLSTSLAIFCHELPHELGDFAVLIDAGMSIKRALLYNGLCACLAFFGTIIGLLIGEYSTSVKLWILAVTAGGFLYVALVDMLPQMLRQCVEKDGFTRFIYQNVGFLIGIFTMLLIAWFEDSFLRVFDVQH